MLSSLYSYITGDSGAVAASGGANDVNDPPVVDGGEGAPEERVAGENGHMAILTETCGNSLVALDTECQRDTPIYHLSPLFGKMYDDLKNTEDGFDTFGRFLAYLRDPRLGKGERATFRKLVLYWLNTQVPDENLGPVVSVVCSLIGEHGYYKDLVIMWEMIGEGDVVEDKSKMMMSFIANFMVNRLRGDMVSERPSMLAKWMPRWRKNRRTNGLIDTVSAGIWSNAIPASVRNGEIADKTRAYLRMQYRKTMSALCEKLNVVERKMCANEWGEIVPKEVPSVATNKYRKAFLNLTVQGGKRHEDPGRILCAERFTEATKSGTLNANVVDIARVVQQMMIEKNQEEIDLLNTTWRKLEDDIGDEIVGMVPMIDVSGSMMGTPMYAAIGIGLMLARKNRGPLNGMQFTFESTPNMCWIEGGADGTPSDQVKSIARAGWGGSTDFQAAMTMLFEHLESHGIREEVHDKVSLVVMSDMQVNQACEHGKSQDTLQEGIVRNFASKEWGTVPPIVFWNLRSTGTTPTRADKIGVISMSGQSTKLARAFLNGESVTKMLQQTPAEKLIEVLSATEQDSAGNMGRQIYRILNGIA